MTFAPDTIHQMLARYRLGAEGTAESDPRVANRHHAALHECYKLLAKTEEGRMLIASLMLDTNPHVRCWAAAHTLQWDAANARRTLERLRNTGGPCSFDAEMVLAEFEKGTLSFDY